MHSRTRILSKSATCLQTVQFWIMFLMLLDLNMLNMLVLDTFASKSEVKPMFFYFRFLEGGDRSK